MTRVGYFYKTPAAKRAIQNIKGLNKKQVIKLEDIISKSTPELKAKKEYMQTDEFWNDEHNKEMTTLYDKMIEYRDKISKNIAINNSNPDAPFQKQGINGFTRIKKWLDKYPLLNFKNHLTVYDIANCDYKFAKTKIYNKAREFKSKIGR